MEPVEREFAAEAASIPELRAIARGCAEEAGLHDRAGEVALAVTEAATNAVLHAFVGREPGTVTLRVEAGAGRLILRVVDDGRGLTPRMDSPGLGLGLPTIGRLCDELHVEAAPGGGTEVRMVFEAPALSAADDLGLQRRLADVLGEMADAVTVSDRAGRMVYANHAAARLLGAGSPEEVVAQQSAELASRFRMSLADGSPVGLDDLPAQRLLAGDEDPPPLLTRSVHLASGRSRWLLTTAAPLHDDQVPDGTLVVSTIRDVTEVTESEHRQRLLAEAGERLASALDLDEVLRQVAAMVVPDLADWCALEVVEPGGLLRRAALAHRDPEKVAFAEEIHRRFPPDPETDQGVYAVLRSGDPIFIPELPDEMLEEGVADPEHLALLRQVGMRSVLLLPMRGHDSVVGVITLIQADSARVFSVADVEFANAVARRAGLAIDTARRLSAG